jgi:hypothetical protein
VDHDNHCPAGDAIARLLAELLLYLVTRYGWLYELHRALGVSSAGKTMLFALLDADSALYRHATTPVPGVHVGVPACPDEVVPPSHRVSAVRR